MTPSHVQHRREGSWYPWANGAVDNDLLNLKYRAQRGAVTKEAVYVNGCLTWALRTAGGALWSIEGGWQREPTHSRPST